MPYRTSPIDIISLFKIFSTFQEDFADPNLMQKNGSKKRSAYDINDLFHPYFACPQ